MIVSKGMGVVVLFLLVVAGSAQAFQETAPGQTPAVPPPATAPSAAGDSGLGLADDEAPGVNMPEGLAGSSIAPDLDFGLELLYGGRSAPVETGSAEDDAGIKGRLKHTF